MLLSWRGGRAGIDREPRATGAGPQVKEYQGDPYYEKIKANHPSRNKVPVEETHKQNIKDQKKEKVRPECATRK